MQASSPFGMAYRLAPVLLEINGRSMFVADEKVPYQAAPLFVRAGELLAKN
jgi:hypothetical protein